MKKLILVVLAVFAIGTLSVNVASAQTKKAVNAKGVVLSAKDAAKFAVPTNKKGAAGVAATRGDKYPGYSDIIVNNYSGYYIEVWVDGSYRTSVAPGYKITTWANPGKTRLVGVARFPDGSTMSWGPMNPVTGYAYTWNLYN